MWLNCGTPTGQLHSQLHAIAEKVVAILNKSEAAEHVIVV